MRLSIQKMGRRNKKLLVAAANYFALNSLTADEFLTIKLTVRFESHKGYMGSCMPVDHRKDRPCRFVIHVDKKCTDEQVVPILAHEITHLKQYHRGELKNISDLETFWKGRKHVASKDLDHIDLEEYQNFAWEKEADKIGRRLVKKFQQTWNSVSKLL